MKFIALTGCDGWDPNGIGAGKGTRLYLSVDKISSFRDITEGDLASFPNPLPSDVRMPMTCIVHGNDTYWIRDTVQDIVGKLS